jgi:hypothetical protein
MPSSDHICQLRNLKRFGDAEAANAAAPETHAALLEAIMIAGRSSQPARRRWRHRWNRRPMLLAAALAAIAPALVIVTPGLLSGGGSATQPQSAQAEILHRITAALTDRPGTIVLQIARVHLIPGGFTQRRVTFRYESLTETSANGKEQRTLTSGYGQRPGFQEATDGQLIELYDPSRNTIYVTTPHAWQALVVRNLPHGVRGNSATITFSSPVPTRLSVPEQELRAHLYRLDGRATIDGRPVLRLTPVSRTVAGSRNVVVTFPTIYVSPRTYYPVREVLPAPRHARVSVAEITTWIRYAVLPGTAANRRLISLSALHPQARIVRGARGYVAAQQRATRG